MRLREIIAAPKSAIKVGAWRNGKVPKADFPIARQAYGLGSSYEWCVITFEALSAHFRVLVIVNEAKQKYHAMLGVMAGGTLRVLCSYEWHASEPGWHVHAACDEVGTVPRGFLRGPWIRRVPGAHSEHRRKSFGVTKALATRIAIDRYHIEEEGPLI